MLSRTKLFEGEQLTFSQRIARTILVGASLAAAILALASSSLANATTGTLSVTTNTTLRENHAGKIVIAKDGVTLDCAGYKITGDDRETGIGRNVGVLVSKRTGVTVKNCDVSNFRTGFLVEDTSGSIFERNVAHNQRTASQPGFPGVISGAGFWLQGSSGNTFRENRAKDNPEDGFDLFSSPNNLFINNTAIANMAGFFLEDHSANNLFQSNSATSNIASGFIIGAANNTLEGNNSDGNSQHGYVLDGITVIGNHISGNTASVNTGDGFFVLHGATNNVISGGDVHHNGGSGFEITESSNHNTLDSNVSSANSYGFFVAATATINTISNNTACGNAGFDGYQEAPNTGNTWTGNRFCTTSGI